MARSPRRRVSAAAASATSASSADQVARVRENLPRPAGGPPSAPGLPAASRRRRRGSPFGFLRRVQPRFIGDIIAELRKVTWPTFAETRYLTMVVAIVAVIMGIFLGLLDLGFGWVIEKLFL